MKQRKLNRKLHAHKGWLLDKKWGVRANLRGSDLSGSNLRGSNLTGSDLRGSNFRYANLTGSDLRGSNFSDSDITGANLRGSDLRGSNLDFSCLPLWCGSIGMIIDDRLAKQFVYHAIVNLDERQMTEFLSDPIAYANGFHRVGEVKKIEVKE